MLYLRYLFCRYWIGGLLSYLQLLFGQLILHLLIPISPKFICIPSTPRPLTGLIKAMEFFLFPVPFL